jgi:hypothetical protein
LVVGLGVTASSGIGVIVSEGNCPSHVRRHTPSLVAEK